MKSIVEIHLINGPVQTYQWRETLMLYLTNLMYAEYVLKIISSSKK
jgi:hypothetical protein